MIRDCVFTTLAYLLSEAVPIVRRDLVADFQAICNTHWGDGAVRTRVAVAANRCLFMSLCYIKEAIHGLHCAAALVGRHLERASQPLTFGTQLASLAGRPIRRWHGCCRSIRGWRGL